MQKNVASQVICAQLVSKTDGSDVTSGTTTVYVTGDGGTQGAGAGTVAHEGNGTWSYVPTQAETNYTHIAFTFVNTSAVSAVVNVYTVGQDFTAAQLNANMTQISGDSTAADNLELATDGGSYNVGGGAVVAASVTAEVSANVTKISSDATAADNAEAFFDGTGYAGTNNVIPTVTSITNRVTVKKNTALAAFPFTMYDSSAHAPTTGLTVTAQRSIDGGAFGACANSVTEVGNGSYKIDLAAADLNGDTIKLKFTATGADQQDITIVTQA